MSARIMDGAALAATIRAELAPQVADFRTTRGRAPALDIVLVGDNPASDIYVRNKERAAAEAGLRVTIHRLPVTSTADEVLATVDRLNKASDCDAILVQSPLPEALGKAATQRVFDAIDPFKDVDGFHPHNVGLLVQGRAHLMPCTPLGVMELLARENVQIAGRHAVVIGRSEIVGKPMALMLLQRDATVTICHSKTPNLPTLSRSGDLLIAAVGRPGFVTAEFVKPGATIVDVGINTLSERASVLGLFGRKSPRLEVFDRKGSVVVGDVHPDVINLAGAMTPVPGGIGPMTIAMLLRNTLTAAALR